MAVELGTGYVRLLPSARGFQAAAKRELGPEMDRVGDDLGDSTSTRFNKGFGSGIAKGAKVAAGGFAAAFAGAAILGKASIDAASNLAETQSKVNTVFGDGAGIINDWAKDSAKALGQSKQQALDNAGSFGNLFVQLGITSDKAADMSIGMVNLASDFASFHNADITEVLTAQQAAFRGEYDAVQRFVPTINAAAVEQKALEMGLGATTDELDAQDKALAVQTLLTEGAGNAAGDFARTADGLANQQRILSARFEDAKASIGEALIPAMTSIVSVISEKVVPWVQELAEKWMPYLRKGFEEVQQWVERNWPRISEVIGTVVETVKSVFEDGVEIIQTIWRNFGDQITAIAESKFKFLIDLIKAGFDVLRGIFKTISALLKGDWSGVWDGLKLIFTGVWDGMIAFLRTSIDTVKAILSAAWEVITAAFKGAWNGMLNFLETYFLEPLRDKINTVKTFLKNTFESAVDGVKEAWDRLKDIVKVPINAVIGFYNTGIRGVWNNVIAKVGLPSLPEVTKLATGGRVPGTGNRDTVPAMLTPGEFVIRKKAAQGWGPDVLEMLNRGPGGTIDPAVFGYARGGAVRSLEEAQEWAKQQAGKPYEFPMVGPGSYDCSGFTSALLNYILGLPVHRRRHSSGSVRTDPALAPGAADGLGLTIGARPPYTMSSAGNFVGHTAASIGNLNAEATPPRVLVGGRARGGTDGMFPIRMHLPGFGGLTDEDKGIVGLVKSLVKMALPDLGPANEFTSMIKSMFNDMPKKIFDFLIGKLPGVIVDAVKDVAGGLFRAVTPFAKGGTQWHDGPRLVGEHGPELQWGSRGEFIQSNESMGRYGSDLPPINVNHYGETVTPAVIARGIRAARMAA